MDYYHIIDQVHMLEVQNIPRINTAVAEWMSVVLFITLLRPRWETRKLIVINLSLLMAESAFLVLTENVPVWLWTPCMMVAYFLMIFQLWISSQISVKEAVYFGTQSFIIAEFAASLEWQLATFIYEGYDIDQSWIWFVLLILVYGGVYLLLHGTLKNHLPREQEMHLTGQALVTEIGIAIFVFALSNIGFWEVRTPFSNHETISMFNMRTMMDLGGVAILFAHMLSCSQASMRTELNNVHKMLESQYQQYKLSRDNIEMVNAFAHFDAYKKGGKIGSVKLSVPGRHNVGNALAALAAADYCGIPFDEAIASLEQFGGACRRFEILAKLNGITFADDYAHHPAELRVTLEAAMQMNYRKVWAVFQPFTYSRTKKLMDDFAEVLQIPDECVMTEIMGSREVNTEGVYTSQLAAKIPGSVWFNTFDEVADYVLDHAQSGDLVITLGCGDIYKAAKIMINRLENAE